MVEQWSSNFFQPISILFQFSINISVFVLFRHQVHSPVESRVLQEVSGLLSSVHLYALNLGHQDAQMQASTMS